MADKWTEEDVKNLDAINKKKAEGLPLDREEEDLLRKMTEHLKKGLDYRKQTLEDQQKRIDLIKAANAEEAKGFPQRARARELGVLEQQQYTDRLKLIQDTVMEGKELVGVEKEIYEKLGGNLEKVTQQIQASEGLAKAKAKANEQASAAVGFENQIKQALYTIVGTQQQGVIGAVAWRGALGGIDKMMSKLWRESVKTMFAMDEAVSKFNQQFQLGEQYTDRITESYKALNQYGVTAEDAAQSQGILTQTVTDFTMASKAQQDQLTEAQLVVSRLGVEQADYAQGVQNSMKMMGQSMGGAINVQGELAATARALGRDQKAFAAEYAKSGHALAKFGDQGVKAFKDLQHISKITGMEMEKVLAITNKFDTFEGAAEQAGKLNAAMGGNFVNAMDLMMATDPAERFGMIRDSILDAGLTFDDMSYYQKNFYKESLGLSDVGDLALMLSGDMDSLAGATNESAESLIEQKKRAADSMSVQDAFRGIIADNSEALVDVAKILNSVTSYLTQNATAVKVLVYALIGLRAMTLLNTAATTIGVFWSGAARVASMLKKKSTIQETIADQAQVAVTMEQVLASQAATATSLEQAAAMQAGGSTAKSVAGPILALGAAFLMLGAGIWIASKGVVEIVTAFKGMEVGAAAAATAIGLLMVPFVAFMAIGYALVTGPQAAITGTVVGLFLALGAAGFLLGAGMALAAAGFGYLVQSFGQLFEVISVEEFMMFVATIGGFYAMMSMLGVLAPFAAAAFMTLAGGLTILGLALALMQPSVNAFTEMINSVTGLAAQSAGLATIAKEFVAIGKAIKELPDKKTVELASLMTATATVATLAGRQAAAPAAAAGGGGGGGQVTVRQPVSIELGGAAMADFVIEVIGDAVKSINLL